MFLNISESTHRHLKEVRVGERAHEIILMHSSRTVHRVYATVLSGMIKYILGYDRVALVEIAEKHNNVSTFFKFEHELKNYSRIL